MELNDQVTLRKNDEHTSVLKIMIDFIIEQFPGVCVGLEIKTGEKYYFHWDLPRLTHIMRRDSDKALFNEAPVKLLIDTHQGRLRVLRKA